MEKETTIFVKDLKKPDERREFEGHGHLDVSTFEDGSTIGKASFEPGWRWSNDVKPIAGTSSCEAEHHGYSIQGTMVVRMDSGEEFTIKAGGAFHIPPGHDAWVVGNETCEMIDVGGFTNYAVKAEELKKKSA
jgi:mannose-6-phosphate isomerase-like protein (cupin superfamily)